ncbi:MAG: hypothetical protein FJ359_02040 [Thaumarchaeota archaeon]|nr:hypothetical protein [Nitrososphaerota archaeon]
MKIIDLTNPQRVNREPDKKITLFSSGNYTEQGFKIKTVQLRQYIEKIDEKLGPFSLITTLVETDKDSIEMLYDEGYGEKSTLEQTADFLKSHLGLSSLILRSVIALKEASKKQNTQ